METIPELKLKKLEEIKAKLIEVETLSSAKMVEGRIDHGVPKLSRFLEPLLTYIDNEIKELLFSEYRKVKK